MMDQDSRGAGALVDDGPAPVDPAPAPATATEPPPTTPGAGDGSTGRRFVPRWVDEPWPPTRIFEVASTIVALAITTFVMMMVVHFNPLNPSADLVFDDNTPTGGDMGAHVWGPAFLRDQLLPNFQLNGWSMDWYAGLPAYRFYMVVPALMIVALDTFLPYGIAFKLVVVAGLVTLPLCCWAFGKLAGFRSPLPQLFAFAGMAFALQESYSIYGGNLKSTMAGEFSFSIALSLGVLGLGLLANAMRTGRYRSWAAIVLALSIVSHGIVAIYVAMAALVVVLVFVIGYLDLRRLLFGLGVGAATVLLSLFWIGPFLGNHDFMTDMKYGGRPDGANDSFWDMFFPFPDPIDFLVTGLAIIGFVGSVARRQLTGTALGVIGLFTVALVYLTRDSLPIIGLLWNPRLLPLLYLVEFLLAMIGLVEVVTVLGNLWRDRRAGAIGGFGTRLTSFAIGGAAVCLMFGFFFEVLPGGGPISDDGRSVYAWGPFRKNVHPDNDEDHPKALGNSWASYNFKGYEGRPQYPEYHDVVQTMTALGEDPTHGCGRAMWENNSANGEYGTTMAFMLLPFWTDGCIASMEGLFFEASGTTPYHFLTTAAMSESSSNPVRELRYTNNDAAVGVRHLQDLGVRYVMLRTDPAKREAAAQDDLELLDTVGPWEIYEVADSDVVVPLEVQPVVVAERPGDQRERHLELGTSWFQNPEDWAALPADDGPDDWQHITVEVDDERRVPDVNKCAREAAEAAEAAATSTAPADPAETTTTAPCQPDTSGKRVDIVVPSEPIQRVEQPEVVVSDVEIGQQDVSFRVDRTGVPILVKVSYFPNWRVEGAEGPYRVAPNFMVVIPTDNDVRLEYARSGSDTVFYGATVAGLGLLVWFRRRGDVDFDVDVDDDDDDDDDDVDDDDDEGTGAGPDDRHDAAPVWMAPGSSAVLGPDDEARWRPAPDDVTADSPRPDPGLDVEAEPRLSDAPEDSPDPPGGEARPPIA